ncbi:hypothetical protein SAMN05444354_116172 [Stigmatella aurantiaca]|uniref:Uncharacterized protein n=2 Tax=Stigmatella aurantiaca TaxID=41 RepID=A0A1H7YB49_STIAU|nr:hypothetical protein SAMN05444354_116172 [Stigmatella aurantiaca]
MRWKLFPVLGLLLAAMGVWAWGVALMKPPPAPVGLRPSPPGASSSHLAPSTEPTPLGADTSAPAPFPAEPALEEEEAALPRYARATLRVKLAPLPQKTWQESPLLSGIRVILEREGFRKEAFTNGQGIALFEELRLATYAVSLDHPDWDRMKRSVHVHASSTEESLYISQACEIRGRLIDPQGKVPRGARLWISGPEYEALERTFGLPAPPADDTDMEDAPEAPGVELPLTPEGNFTLERIDCDDYVLFASAPGYGPVERRIALSTVNVDNTGLVLLPAAALLVKVRGSQEQWGDTTLRVSQDGPEQTLSLDERGTALFEGLTGGEVTVELQQGKGPVRSRTVHLEEGKTGRVDFSLESSTLTVTVVDDAGQPLNQRFVLATCEGEGGEERLATTNTNGVAVFGQVPLRPCTLSLPDWPQAGTFRVTPPGPARWVFPSAEIEARIEGIPYRSSPESVWLLEPLAPPGRRVFNRGVPSFFSRLPAGRYRLTFRVAEGGGEAEVEVTPGSKQKLTVPITHRNCVRAKLLHAGTRQPLARAHLAAPVLRDGERLEWKYAAADEQGEAALCGVLRGNVRVAITETGFQGHFFNIDVQGDVELGTLLLEPVPEPTSEVLADDFIASWSNEAGLPVVAFEDGAPVWAAALRQGDEILEIDGTPTKGGSPGEWEERVAGNTGTLLRLKIRRQGRVLDISIPR